MKHDAVRAIISGSQVCWKLENVVRERRNLK